MSVFTGNGSVTHGGKLIEFTSNMFPFVQAFFHFIVCCVSVCSYCMEQIPLGMYAGLWNSVFERVAIVINHDSRAGGFRNH